MRTKLLFFGMFCVPSAMLAFAGCGSETEGEDTLDSGTSGTSSTSGASGFSSGSNDDSGTSSGASGTSGGSSGGHALDAGLEAFCAGEGSLPLPTTDGGPGECAGDIANRVFNFAICSCENLTFSNALRTTSFDSMSDAGATGAGASVGVNGTLSTNNVVQVAGSLWSGAGSSASNGTDFAVAYDWVAGGNIQAAGGRVAHDVVAEGNVDSSGTGVTVGNRLRLRESSTAQNFSGQRHNEMVQVEDPCNCDNPVDVASIIAALAVQNDNAEREVEATALTGDSFDVSLECGRYYFDRFSSNGSATLRIRGRAIVAIAGDVLMANSVRIELAPGAELDLFVGGSVTFNGAPTIGDPTRPFATRIYVAGTSVVAAGALDIAANIYGPRAAFRMDNAVDLKGSLFGKSFVFSGPTQIRYDEAILQTQGCDRPGRSCTSCGDCGNPTPACKGDGTCGPCTSDQECCAPLVCNVGSGQCQQPSAPVN